MHAPKWFFAICLPDGAMNKYPQSSTPAFEIQRLRTKSQVEIASSYFFPKKTIRSLFPLPNTFSCIALRLISLSLMACNSEIRKPPE